jgi:mannitol 2-dehydrogenase
MTAAISGRKLDNANLSKISREIRTPSYDRSRLLQNTVHIGVGGFHRAHQAAYLDDLLERNDTERWGECGVGLLKSDYRMRDALKGQDYLYTLVERSAEKQTARVIGSIADYVFAPEEREAAIEKLAATDTKIVSLTITEGGYFINEGTGEFTADHPDIIHDLQYPGQPNSSLGYMAEALDRRRFRGLAPFTVMSCDNLQGNGHVVKKVLLAFAGLRDVALQQWIADHVAFPNSMVDRITPATTANDIAFVSARFGIDDAWPVVTEPFIQWVVEDTFCNGRPQWERAGVQLVSDVAPYEIMKMRLLNASHLAMGYLGALAGYTYL